MTRLHAILASLALAALLPASAYYLPAQLDPSVCFASDRPETRYNTDAFNMSTFFIPRGGLTSVTAIVWARYTKLGGDGNEIPPFVIVDATHEPARATQEGGDSLPNLCEDGEMVNAQYIDLDADHTWALECLPATYDCPEGLESQWGYGCYVVNLTTDTPLTLTVGDTEIYVPEPTNMVRNVQASSASRWVTIVAEGDASVRFGIAENPLRQFVGAQTPNDPSGGWDTDYGSLSTQWRMFVLRAAVSNGVAVTCYDCLSVDEHFDSVVTRQTMWHPRADFARNSRLRFMCAALGGGLVDRAVTVGMRKSFGRWLSDADLERIRDKDVAEFERRGSIFPELDPDWRRVDIDVVSSQETVESNVESTTNGMSYSENSVRRVTSYNANCVVISSIRATNGWTTADYEFDCPGAAVSGSAITFPSAGVYQIRATDPNGVSVMSAVTVSRPYTNTVSTTVYTSDANAPCARFSQAVIDGLANATPVATGTVYTVDAWERRWSYRKWNTVRLPAVPVNTTVAPQGHYSKHAISPHVVATAKHYTWWPATQLTFRDEQGNEGTVQTVANMLSLDAWAATNGFTAAEIAAANISDLVVCRVTSGAIPDGCCPWFMSTNRWNECVGQPFGVLGWRASQTNRGQGIPALVGTQDYGGSWREAIDAPWSSTVYSWSSAWQAVADNRRSQMLAIDTGLEGGWMWPVMYGGDSGLPVFIQDSVSGKFILVANGHWKTAAGGGGTSYVAGFRILKAYVEWCGDTLKEY